MDSREQRKAQNEALHRRINENLEQLNEAFGSLTGTFEIVCECSDLGCLEHITISIADYDELRSDPTRFAVVEGHEDAGVEYVVSRRPDYLVVQKKPGEPATRAAELA